MDIRCHEGKGLRRLAVAQLGSNDIDGPEFSLRTQQIWHDFSRSEGLTSPGPEMDHLLADTAEKIVQVLIDMKSPGCEYLDLIDEAPSE